MEIRDKDNIKLVESSEYYKTGASNSLRFQPTSKKQVTSRYISYLRDALKDAQTKRNNVETENIDNEEKEQKVVDYSKYIEELQDEISFLERTDRVIDGNQRALKLPKAGEPILENVAGVYKIIDSKHEQISVSKVADENKIEVASDIDKAIEENSMKKTIDEFAKDALSKIEVSEDEKEEVSEDIVEPVIEPSFKSNSEMVDEIKEKADEQEKVENNVESIKENSLEEFKPKTEEEVTEYRNNAMEDAFKIFNSDESKEEVIRDSIAVIPERDENKEEKVIDEFVTVEKDPKEFEIELGKNVPEYTSAKEIVASGDLKEKLKDDYKEKYKDLSYEELLEKLSAHLLLEKLSAQNSRKSELRKKLKDAEEAQEEAIKINFEVIEEEENVAKAEVATAEEEANIEKKNAELKAEDERKKKELRDLALEKLSALLKENAELDTTIGVVNEKSASLKENTEVRRENIINKRKSMETRRENITNINRDNEQLQESIESKDKEIQMMLGESHETDGDYGKVK